MKRNRVFAIEKNDIVQLVESMGYCMASDDITVKHKPIGYMYRETPDDADDSGWRFFSGEETQEYVDDPQNFGIFDVNTIANYDSAIIPYLKSPAGSELVRVNDAEDFQMIE